MTLAADSSAAVTLVTGAAGFLGRRVAARMMASGHDVVGFDDLSVGSTQDLPAGLQFVPGDIRDVDAVDRLFGSVRPARIVHLAALHHIPSCNADPRRCLEINVVGTQAILDAARRHGVECVVLASTGAVYAWSDEALEESAPLRPSDVYGLSKATNERQLGLWAEETGGRGRIARIFNAIGSGDRNAHLLPDLIERLRAAPPRPQRAALRIGNLHTRRDYVHAEDVADGLVALAADSSMAALATYNLSTGREHSVAEVATLAADLLDRDVELQVDPALVRANDRPSQCGRPDLAAMRLGWRPQRTLRQALAEIAAARC